MRNLFAHWQRERASSCEPVVTHDRQPQFAPWIDDPDTDDDWEGGGWTDDDISRDSARG